ncbi:penicillin acylase family protein [Mariniluteicoccus endophyticus]
MRHIPRGLVVVLLVVVLALASIASLAVVTVRESFPNVAGTVVVQPLGRPVKVVRDARGVPHIYADTAEDLFAAQGYVHAQERFFEMDVRRHITAGRLSEMFGPTTVETDAYVRTMGWRRVAEQEVAMMSSRTRSYLDAYAAGVNAYAAPRSLPELSLEYALLGLQGRDISREPWTAADSLAWLKAMAWDLSGNRMQEIEQAVMQAAVGPTRAGDLLPDYDPEVFEPIVTQGAVLDGKFDPQVRGDARPAPVVAPSATTPEATRALLDAARVDDAVPDLVADPRLGGEVGSNSWVVAGNRSASGKPILANDPHLSTSIPSVFMQVGLHCNRVGQACPFDVSGFSFSGMPGVIIGHNAHIAWGFTVPYLDTQDLFVEQLVGQRYRRGQDLVDLDVREEVIRVAGAPDKHITVRSTGHGPLLSDVDRQLKQVPTTKADGATETAVSLAWTALTPSTSIEAIFVLGEAKDFDGFRRAASLLRAPSQNLLYADVAGNIGYQLPGDIPVRRNGNGLLPRDGANPEDDWTGMVPFDELPNAYNPESGYIVAANQQIIANHPRLLGSDASLGWRSQQIVDRLNDHAAPMTIEDAMAVQGDSTVRYAKLIVPALLQAQVTREWDADGQEVLRNWDFRSGPDSTGAAYFHVVMRRVLARTFDDELPPELRTQPTDRWYGLLAQLVRDPNNPWWDDQRTSAVENRDTVLAAALTDARKEITVLLGRDPSQWRWGDLHRLELKHQTLGKSGIGPVERVFNRGDEPVGGGPAVVEAFAFGSDTFRPHAGPTMKMVVDLSDLDNSRWVNQSGTSGHAYHPNYDDQLRLLASNTYLPWRSSRQRIEQESTTIQTLNPPG